MDSQPILEKAGDPLDILEQLLELAPDAMLVVDEQGLIQRINQQAERLLGFSKEELQGNPIEQVVPSDLRKAHVQRREQYFETPARRPMGSGLELEAQRSDGSRVPVEVSISPVRAATGRFVVAAVRDITLRRRNQQALERSNAELEHFAYVASHDLQEPLRMMASYSQLLARRYRGKLDEDADEFIEFIVDGATRMKALINDLLAYSRIGRTETELLPTKLDDCVAEALANLSYVIEESNATVNVADLPTVLGDSSQLVQLLQNLIGNAIKFRGDKPAIINIDSTTNDDQVEVRVEDNGIGIEQAYRERVFAMFQRLHTRDEYEGTGIGLAICRKIVNRHNGEIWVESEPGVGTTFHFTLEKASEA